MKFSAIFYFSSKQTHILKKLSPYKQTQKSIMACLEVERERRVERRRIVGRRVEKNSYLPPCLDVFKISKRCIKKKKLVKGKGVISLFSYLDVLKIMMEMKGNDLNKKIYPYLKMNLQH